MKKLVACTLGALTLALGAASAHAAAPDLAFDASRLYVSIDDPTAIHMAPNTKYNPLLLPCDVEVLGSQVDFAYTGNGPTIYPRVEVRLFDSGNQPISSNGCSNIPAFDFEAGDLGPITPGTTQTDGLTLVSSTNQFCSWLFQPGDLPSDEVVRVQLALTAYRDAGYSQLLVDSATPNDVMDVFVKRECSCQ